MSLQDFSLMRHELILTAAAVLVLIAEIFWNPAKKRSISLFCHNFVCNCHYYRISANTEGAIFVRRYVHFDRFNNTDKKYT